MLQAYMDAGYIPVAGCNFDTAMEYVKKHFEDFSDNISFQDDRFFADVAGTKYYWENNMLFIRRQ